MGPNVIASIAYYNAKPFIRRAVESLLNQTYQNITVIVVNDGDTESPRTILADISDPRLVCFDLQVNRGPYFANAVSLGASNSEFFLISDADDWSEPDRVEKLLAPLQKTDAVASLSSLRLIREPEGSIYKAFPNATAKPPHPSGYEMRAPHQGLFRSAALKSIGGYYGGFRIAYDTFIVNVLPMIGEITYLDQPLYNRLHRPDSLSQSPETGVRTQYRLSVKEQLVARYAEVYGCYINGLPANEIAAKVKMLGEASVPSEDLALLKAEQQRLSTVLQAMVPQLPNRISSKSSHGNLATRQPTWYSRALQFLFR